MVVVGGGYRRHRENCNINSSSSGSINRWASRWAKFKRKDLFFCFIARAPQTPWVCFRVRPGLGLWGTQSLDLPLTAGFWHCCNTGHISIMEALHFPNKTAPVGEISLEIRAKQQNSRYLRFGAYQVCLGAHLPIPQDVSQFNPVIPWKTDLIQQQPSPGLHKTGWNWCQINLISYWDERLVCVRARASFILISWLKVHI